MNIIQFPVIAGVEITTDAEGRFNLNALHRAHLELNPDIPRNSKQPSDWLKLEGTKELIEAISNSEDSRFNSEDLDSAPVVSKAGRYGGTFAHELLAIEYAGWISPKFRLLVNQTFLDFKTGKLAPVKPMKLSEALRLAADLEEAKERAEAERDEAIRTKALIGAKREATSMARAAAEKARAESLAKQLGISTNWKQVKAIDWVTVIFEPTRPLYQQLGKLMRKVSSELGMAVVDIEDSQYGTVKAYHVDVIGEVYRRIRADSKLLERYRKLRVVA